MSNVTRRDMLFSGFKGKLKMKTISKYLFIPILFLFISLSSCAVATNLPELKPYLRKSILWKCTTLNKEVPLNIYFLNDSTGNDGAEVIVYVKNQAWERIGKESDLSILSDYIHKKFIVITVDFGNDPRAVSTHFDKDIHDIFKAVYGYKTESLLIEINLVPANYRCFFLPEGYRVATDLVYWEIDKHAVFGTMEFIMESYNEDIVPQVPGLKPVSSPMEMVDSKGKPFDYTVKMDIVYPSRAKKTLPAFFYSATLSKRNPNGKPSAYRPHMAGITMRGYVYILMGHCFNPCVNHFFHFNKFELDHWNGLACYTAAMRYIHANASKYSINTEYIGGLGHSKGQYAITRLSVPNHAGGDESMKYKGFPEGTPEPQPWQGYPSNIKVGYQSMGMGTFEPEYITPDYVPTIIACGEKERDVISKEGHPKFVKRLEELDVNFVELFMQGLGHELPYGYDEKMGVDRYELVHDFFDRYLKVEEKLPPVALLISPRDNKEGVSPTEKISVQFAPVIDEESILKDNGIRVIQTKVSKEIEGSWMISRGGTKFTFTPKKALVIDEQYKIFVTSKVKNKAGTFLKNEKITHFKVAAKTELLLGVRLWTNQHKRK
ncbi:MAG: Ig-like domain-containing protein [Bacteroidales bacterium]|nr:Ig-like domain-containing protein [Bacteroidales bacterium]